MPSLVTTWHGEFGYGVVPPLVEAARTVADALPLSQVLGHLRMVLPALELSVRVEVGVLVVETNHHAQNHLWLLGEAAARGVIKQQTTT